MIRRFAVILLMAGSLAGCAAGATAGAMTIRPDEFKGPANPALKGAVAVGPVAGGGETNPLWISDISADEFRGALQGSLSLAGLLAPGPAKYELRATLVQVDKPMFGFDMTTTTQILYKLQDTSTKTVLLEEKVTAAHTATVSDAFVGSARVKLANEGSARKNIAAALEKVNAVKVSPAPPPGLPVN